MYTAIAGATGALYGPLHGGANEVYDTISSCVLTFYLNLDVRKDPRLIWISFHVSGSFKNAG